MRKDANSPDLRTAQDCCVVKLMTETGLEPARDAALTAPSCLPFHHSVEIGGRAGS